MRHAFQPRACIAARSFLLAGRPAFLAFVVDGTTSTPCRNTERQYCSWQFLPTLSGGKGGIPNDASFGSTGGFLSLLRVSTRYPFISKEEFMFLPVARRIIGQPGSDHAVVDAIPHSHGGWPGIPGGRLNGTPNSTSFGSFSFLSRSLASDLFSYRFGHTTFSHLS